MLKTSSGVQNRLLINIFVEGSNLQLIELIELIENENFSKATFKL